MDDTLNTTNSSAALLNGTAHYDEEALSSEFAYSWAPPLIGSIAVLGLILSVAELIIIGTNRSLRNNTNLMLVAGNE